MQKFTVHWSQVSDGGLPVFALWPSPMTADTCFREAGFTDFGDGDEQWDIDAAGLLSRLLDELCRFGAARLTSEPVEKHQSLFQRLLCRPEPLSLREQIEVRTVYDEFPDCVVTFGESAVTLRTGGGHHIFWISLPRTEIAWLTAALPRIAGEHPLVRTDLKWDCLLHQT
jgi:hypothetical protein